ncbi:hypothetical protein K5L01_06625 [Stenotrophomonas sp. CPCC 101365]|uniref:Uncharacterized protein n=1 Tax=Stenotrophomonas mori TaxID=2871096 RepID=A0ABT0SG75_9GAMM|nr:hypothetical protein [Stenotrophomonas mori]
MNGLFATPDTTAGVHFDIAGWTCAPWRGDTLHPAGQEQPRADLHRDRRDLLRHPEAARPRVLGRRPQAHRDRTQAARDVAGLQRRIQPN